MSIYVMAPVLRADVPAVAAREGRRPDPRGCDAPTLKLVLLGLADSANEDGTDAHPGLRNLAQFAQCHTQTAARALVCLVELGAIRNVERGGGRRRGAYDIDLGWVRRAVERADKKRRSEAIARPKRALAVVRASEARAARASEARANARPRGAHIRPVRPDVPAEPAPTGAAAPPWVEAGLTRDVWLRVQCETVEPDATWEDHE